MTEDASNMMHTDKFISILSTHVLQYETAL